MKKFIYFLMFSFVLTINAQLSIGNNSYVMVRDAVLFSQNYVDLKNETSSNLYLRKDGQLIQNLSTNTNTGDGKLSVYQEGTSSNWQHNLWCSPVGNPAVAGNPFGINMLNRPTNISDSSTITGLAYTVQNTSNVANTPEIASRWIATYTGSWIRSYQSNSPASTTPITAGLGFSMKGSRSVDTAEPFTGAGQNNSDAKNQRYDFRGRPNTGDFSHTISAAGGWYLVGNPYPSAIDLNLFFNDSENSCLTKVAYYWEQKDLATHNYINYEGGYGDWTPNAGNGTYNAPAYKKYDNSGVVLPSQPSGLGSGTGVERRYAPIGQGFMVKATTANCTFMFKNSHRAFIREGAATLSQFRNGNSIQNCDEYNEPIPNIAGIDYTQFKKFGPPTIQLEAVTNVTNSNFLSLVFHDEADDNYMNGHDTVGGNNSDLGVYLKVTDRPNDSFVTSTTNFSIDKQIPLIFKAVGTNETPFKLKVGGLKNCFDSELPIYLYDSETDTYHNIKDEFYNISLPAGTYADRFQIRFQNQPLSIVDNQSNNGLVVSHNNNQELLTLHNLNLLVIDELTIYDLSGRKILGEKKLGSNHTYQFSTQNFQSAAYLIYIKTGNNLTFKDKIIKN
jgi:hypothetical protein